MGPCGDRCDSLCFPRTAADLRKQQVHTKGGILVIQVALEFGNLLAEHVWSIANLLPVRLLFAVRPCLLTYTSDDAQSSGIGDGCGELRASCNVHASQEDWVLDLQEICDGSLNLLWGGHVE